MYILDKTLLFPYWATLKLRHAAFNCSLRKSHEAELPTIAIGNVTVGGTGKTPHTEMLLRMLTEDFGLEPSTIAVLSRGHKRKSRGFQQVTLDGSARAFGDEPLQMKRKFPLVTVAVDKNRLHGADLLCHPDKIGKDRHSRKCLDKDLPKAELIVLDDALQYRKLKPSISIMLVDWNRPPFNDHLLPLGSLRDLPERLKAADIVIVTKCPGYIDGDEKIRWRKKLGLSDEQELFFTEIGYCKMDTVFPEGEPRYLYSQRLILFSGIANDRPLFQWLSGNYQIVGHLKFPDHHRFTPGDIRQINSIAAEYPTSLIVTTEKDSQRIRDMKKLPQAIRERLFQAPIEVSFVGEGEKERFAAVLRSGIEEN